MQKRGAWQLPVYALSICPGNAEKRYRRHAPHERCVNGVKILGPVESCLPPCTSYCNSAFTAVGGRMQANIIEIVEIRTRGISNH